MKKSLYLLTFLILSACRSFMPVQPEVSRSQIYYGQTLAALYENFGAPQKAEKFAYGVSMYIFNQQEIISEGIEKFFYDCKLRVFVQNDHVIDWDWQGNSCQFTEGGPGSQVREDFDNNKDLIY